MKHLALLVLLISAMTYSSNALQYTIEYLQLVYNGFQDFKNTKAFDPDDSKIPLQKYLYFYNYYYRVTSIAITINGVSLVEDYRTDGHNKIKTKNGQYQDSISSVNLKYKRNTNGEFSFEDLSNSKKFNSSLRSIDAELPSDFEEDYKKVLVDLNAMRKKIFDFRNGLNEGDLERVQWFEFMPSATGSGFNGLFVDNRLGAFLSRTKTMSFLDD